MLVFLVALAARLTHIQSTLPGTTGESALPQALHLDSKWMADRAADIRSGSGLQTPYQLSPLYPYGLALFPDVDGSSQRREVLGPLYAQALLGALTAVLAALLAGRCAGGLAALLGGLLAALHGPSLFYEGQLIVAGPQAFLLTLGLLLSLPLLRGEGPGPRRTNFLAGLALGLASALRPTTLPLAAALYLLGVLRPTSRQASHWLLAGLAVAILPFSARNLLVAQEPVLLSCSGGFNFWAGNHTNAPGIFSAPAGYDLSADPVAHDQAQARAGRDLSYGESSRWWASEALDDLTQDPVAGLLRFGRKLLLFAHTQEIPQLGAGFGPHRAQSLALRWPVNSALLLLLALAAPWLLRSHGEAGRAVLRLGGIGADYALTIAAFFVAGRYRAPILPLAAALAGISLQELWSLLRRADKARFATALASLVSVALLGAWIFTQVLQIQAAAGQEILLRQRGLELIEAGQAGEAIPLLQQALDEGQSLSTREALARAYSQTDAPSQAALLWREVLAQDPARSQAHFELAALLMGPLRGDTTEQKLAATREAEGLYRAALTHRPGWPEAHFNLGATLLNQRRFPEAEVELQRALDRAPQQAPWRSEAMRALEIARGNGQR